MTMVTPAALKAPVTSVYDPPNGERELVITKRDRSETIIAAPQDYL